MAETVEKPEATHIPVLTTENSEESSSATSASSTEKNENNTNRVYISNVDFSTTEDDVLGFLRDYNVYVYNASIHWMFCLIFFLLALNY